MKPTLSQFYKELEKHDWYHMFSDDGAIDERGATNMRWLKQRARESGPEFEELLTQFKKHHFTGEPWKTTKFPKPEMPKESE